MVSTGPPNLSDVLEILLRCRNFPRNLRLKVFSFSRFKLWTKSFVE